MARREGRVLRPVCRDFAHASREERELVLVEYLERRKATLMRLYGRRWAEVYNSQTMLKEDDHGGSD